MGFFEMNRLSSVYCLEHDGGAHGIGVGLIRGGGLIKFRFSFASHPAFCPGQHAHRAVTSGVNKDIGQEGQVRFGGILVSGNGKDALSFHLGGAHIGIEKKGQVFLEMYLFP